MENNTMPLQPPEQQDQHHATNDSRNQQFTCEICIEPTSNPDKRFKNADKCSHPFCTDCIVNYIRAKLENNNIGQIKCPSLNCDQILDPIACTSVVGPATFLRWTDVLCEVAIMGWEKCYCPYGNCNVLILNECGGSPRKSKCPSCKSMFCFHCKRVWHAGFRCEESNQFRDMNDVAFGSLVESKNWKRCPQCKYFIERWEGCEFIKCRCGIEFCYNCGERVCSCRSSNTTTRDVQAPTTCEVQASRSFAVFIMILLALILYVKFTWGT